VIAGAAEFGIAVGTQGAMAAYAKGAPVRIIGAEATGAADYWYARTTSPIKTLADTNGRTIAFSTQGSSTQSIVRAFIDEFKLTARPMSTGNPAATLTAVMTNQVDVGWASPPFGLREIDAGQIRVIARATDSALVRGQTVRVLVANADTLAKRKDMVVRFLDAYRETVDLMYHNDPGDLMSGGLSEIIREYAAFAACRPRWRCACATSSSPRTWSTPTRFPGSTAW
jgi:NitT/TauT family transport system substrate-binding protein